MPGLKLIAELGGDGRGFQKMMGGASSAVNSLGSRMAGLFTLGAITAFTKSTLDWAGSLQDVADGLEVNVEWFQKMANGAKLAGSSAEDLQKFLGDLNVNRAAAVQEPGGAKAKAFTSLGFSGSDVATLNTEQFMAKLIERFKNGADAQGINALREVGGKSARNLAAAFATQFASDAPILSADMVSQLDTAGDSLTDLGTTLKVTLAPAIIWVTEKLVEFINWFKQLGAFFGGVIGAASTGENPEIAGGMAAEEERQRQLEDKRNRDRARASSLAAAKERAAAGPNFSPLIESKKDEGKPKSREVDSFTASGRLFGRAGVGVNTIANMQLDTARQQLKAQQDANVKLDRLISKSSTQTSGFPPIR